MGFRKAVGALCSAMHNKYATLFWHSLIVSFDRLTFLLYFKSILSTHPFASGGS